jgi:hypothetical protein
MKNIFILLREDVKTFIDRINLAEKGSGKREWKKGTNWNAVSLAFLTLNYKPLTLNFLTIRPLDSTLSLIFFSFSLLY